MLFQYSLYTFFSNRFYSSVMIFIACILEVSNSDSGVLIVFVIVISSLSVIFIFNIDYIFVSISIFSNVGIEPIGKW